MSQVKAAPANGEHVYEIMLNVSADKVEVRRDHVVLRVPARAVSVGNELEALAESMRVQGLTEVDSGRIVDAISDTIYAELAVITLRTMIRK